MFEQSKAEEADALLETLAAQGNRGALFRLGVSYELGRGVAQSYGKAWNCYSQAADQGFLRAIHKQGLFYFYGWNVEKSEEKAKLYWLRAAEGDFAPSQYLLATCSFSTVKENERPDDATAMFWLRRAADQDLPEAVCILGIEYACGTVSKRDRPLGYALLTWSLHHKFRIEPWLKATATDTYRILRAGLSDCENARGQSLLAKIKLSRCGAVAY